MTKRILLIIFVLASGFYLLAGQSLIAGIVTKPLIVASLLVYYLLSTASRSTVFVFALLFCCAGDTLLLFEARNEVFFLFGLVSFLAGHVLYILSFFQHRGSLQDGAILTQRMRLAFPVLLAGTGLTIVLLPALGALRIPVIIYSAVLTFMVVSAVLRMGFTGAASFWSVFAGAALFMLSDSLLAINKFLSPLDNVSIWVMLTYCSAQFLIVRGILIHTTQE